MQPQTTMHLVLATLKVKLKSFRDMTDRPHCKFRVHSFKTKVKAEEFGCELKNKFETLSGLLAETIDEHWENLRQTWKCTCSEVLGKREKEHKEWLTPDTWALISARKRSCKRNTSKPSAK